METHLKGIYKKILIIRLSSIGDIILTTPLIRALRKRFPEAIIDFVVKECFLDLVRTNPHLNTVIVFDHTKGFRELYRIKRLIKQEQYDVILDIHRNFRSFFLRTNSGAAFVMRYPKYYVRRSLLIYFGMSTFRTIEPIYKRYFYAVKSFGVVPDELGTELIIPDSIVSKISVFLKGKGIEEKQPLVVLCPGAGFATKRWFPEGYARVGDYFIRWYGAYVCILGSEQDYEICREVQGMMFNHSENCAGMFSLLEASALLKQAALVITNDTGLMHIAQSQKRPVAAIFGSTTRELGYFPFPESSFVIERDISCRPCSHNGRQHCPKWHFKCIRDISPETVIEAAEQLFVSEMSISGKDYGKNMVSAL